MPSDLRQLNARLGDDDWALAEQLQAEAARRLGIPVSQSDLIRLALRALAREYAPAAEPTRKRK